ncbi:dd656930-c404-4982-ac4a-13dafa7553f3 [Sclerotinia trifoliorum]|uniref:Dd656930-c404-4982-ac4a-13dafa7553f3 n=1 Tax=Sclerotinia trifoliorum TaxID=28548 RepID=A0A8H2ZT51_9HELO|nr:dd656930-c404-4982-ac4a-13dafa7553f3 [Sclerotinia trifoliorum]
MRLQSFLLAVYFMVAATAIAISPRIQMDVELAAEGALDNGPSSHEAW